MIDKLFEQSGFIKSASNIINDTFHYVNCKTGEHITFNGSDRDWYAYNSNDNEFDENYVNYMWRIENEDNLLYLRQLIQKKMQEFNWRVCYQPQLDLGVD